MAIKTGTRISLTEAMESLNTPTPKIRISLSDALKFEEENPTPQPLSKAGKVIEVLKGVPRGFENVAGGVGALTQWIGESKAEDVPRILISDVFRATEKRVGQQLAIWGENAYNFWRKEAQRGIEAPDPNIFRGSFMQNPSWVRGVAIVAEAIPSLATATAVTFATGNPLAGAASLGLIEGSEEYVGARKAGKSVKFSSGVGTLSTIGTTVLEVIPLTRFLRGGEGKLIKDIFVGAIQEGSEEVLQALWNNAIVHIGYDKTRDLTQGMVEGFIGGAGSGGLIGGITSGRGIKTDAIAKEAVEKGIPPGQIETMQEAVKEQIISKADEINEVLETTEAPLIPLEKPPVAPVEAIEPEVGVEAIPKVITPEERLAQLEEEKTLREQLSRELEQEKTLQSALRVFQEEPEAPATAKEAALEELAAAGFDIKSQAEIESQLEEIGKRAKSLRAQIKALKPRIVPARQEITAMRQRVRDIARGAREGKISTKKEIKQTQDDLIALIEQSGLEAKDVKKFVRTIKNVQTAEDLTRVNRETRLTVLQEIQQRIERLVQSAEKDRLAKQIKRELKATKPTKVGQKRVGKFDFDRNKLFDELRSFNSLTQTEAQNLLFAYPDEGNTEIDLIKKRFLSLRANGKSSSVEMFSKVNEDIKRMKALGKQAKSEADFEKLLQRQERADEALGAIGKIKADKKGIKTKIINIYRKGFSNIYSMINSTFGKKLAEKYDPEIDENSRDTAIYFKTKAMVEEISRIYGEENAFKVLEKLAIKDYRITDIEGLTTELSKLELIDIYNSLKNEAIRQRYNDAFGEGQVQELLGNLDKSDEAFANFLQETVQGYKKVMNTRNIEITGRDMGVVENYWPATSEFEVSVLDDIRIQGETPSALKERAKGKVIPIPRDAWLKAQKHIAQGEHVDKLSRKFETLKRLFNDRKVKHTIKEKFGDDIFSVLQDQIDNISLNAQTKKIDAVSQWFKFLINNWVSSKIALNPSTYIRQLMSVGNYIEQMNSGKWVEGFRKGVLSPKTTFDFMWKNAPFLEARFNRGYSEALKSAIAGAERINVNWSSYTKFLTSLARSGDITAIIYGGFPLVQSELAKGKTMKQAIETFAKATLKSQQSGLSSSISQFQNSRNPFARLFLAFKNTANQYLRKMADATISRMNGDISSSQYVKTMLIYAIIQPIMYISSGFLLREFFKGLGNIVFGREGEEPEEVLQKLFLAIITQIAISPVNAIPVIDDIARFAVRKVTGQKVWKVFSTPLFDDLETGLRKLAKKEVTAEDYLIASTSVLEPITALPMKVYIRIFNYIRGEKKTGRGKGTPRI